VTAGADAGADGRVAAPDPARLALVEAGLPAAAAGVAFAAALIALQVTGRDEAGALGGCLLLALACGAARAARTRPTTATVAAGLLAGAAAVVAGAHDHLVFLPAVVLLIALTPIARPSALAAAVAAATAGFLVSLWTMPTVNLRLALVAAGVAVLPWVARAVGRRHGPRRGTEVVTRTAPIRTPETSLSERQLEVLALLSRGLRQREAAERLGLSVHQVGHLLRDARARTGASTRELVARHAARPGRADD
jgi:DNA-binding CsgD family transcriptional regulator